MTEKGRQRRDFYTKQCSRLENELAAIEADLESAPRAVDRLRLKSDAERVLAEIEETEKQLVELDSQHPDQGVRDRGLEKILQKIDFKKAKKAASLVKDRLNEDGGAVLFFLQKSKKQMGQYCVEEVINVIMGDQIVDGQVVGAYRRIPVDLGSAISQYNEAEFLIRLASYFKIEESNNLTVLSKQLRETIRSSIDSGTTIFLEIKSLDDLLEQEEFLGWFIAEFWKPLIDEVTAVSKKYKSKFIVALIADSQILSDCSPAYFCKEEAFDCYKMLELPLPNWTIDDIHYWLIRFRTLSAEMREKTDAELKQVARKIYRDSDGTPESVCVSLQGKFL